MGAGEQLFNQLSRFRNSKTLILGIGNTLKGDDGAGPEVCRGLVGRISADVIDAGSVPENYIGPIVKKCPESLLVIDAIDFDASPGTIELFEPRQLDGVTISTHTLSPRLFVNMICQQIAVDVSFIGIQPMQIELGSPLSPQVDKAVDSLITVLMKIFPPGE